MYLLSPYSIQHTTGQSQCSDSCIQDKQNAIIKKPLFGTESKKSEDG